MEALAASAESAEVELLLFEVGGQRYGADASQVLRIDRAASNAVTWASLGTPKSGQRALVFRGADAEAQEAQLRVDSVTGVRPVALEALRRLPPAASQDPTLIGVWLDGDTPVLLLDLRKTASSAPSSAQ